MNFKLPELKHRVVNSNELVAPAETLLVIDAIIYVLIIL